MSGCLGRRAEQGAASDKAGARRRRHASPALRGAAIGVIGLGEAISPTASDSVPRGDLAGGHGNGRQDTAEPVVLIADNLKAPRSLIDPLLTITPAPRSLHKRPIEPRWFAVTGRVKEQIRAGRQIGQGKQIYPVGARQIGAVLHDEVAAQHALQIQQRIACPTIARPASAGQSPSAAHWNSSRCPPGWSRPRNSFRCWLRQPPESRKRHWSR